MNEENRLPKRKPNRLKYYDYSTDGIYFITICAEDRKSLFGRVEECDDGTATMVLSDIGTIVSQGIAMIPQHYETVLLDHYVVMPNHVHLLLRIETGEGRPMVAPTVSTVVQQMKGYVTKQVGFSVWQKLFHDHVIRNEHSYRKIWEYIDNNPAKWREDCFYSLD